MPNSYTRIARHTDTENDQPIRINFRGEQASNPNISKPHLAPFRWNPFDKTDYKKGYSNTFRRELFNFWSVLYGTKPTALNIFSASIKAVRSSGDALNDMDASKLTKPMQQIVGYKVRAGLLDFIPSFGLGRLLDQAGRRVNILTNPAFALAKWIAFPITLPLYIVAKAMNIVKGIVAGVITLVALPFLAIKFGVQAEKRKAAIADKAGVRVARADDNTHDDTTAERARRSLPSTNDMHDQFRNVFANMFGGDAAGAFDDAFGEGLGRAARTRSAGPRIVVLDDNSDTMTSTL